MYMKFENPILTVLITNIVFKKSLFHSLYITNKINLCYLRL